MSLDKMQCIPCQGGIPPLSTEQSHDFLKMTPGWVLIDKDSKLALELSFSNFQRPFDLISKISTLAETEGHHPDLCFGWGYVRIILYTHKINGLHQNDFIMAAKINEVLKTF